MEPSDKTYPITALYEILSFIYETRKSNPFFSSQTVSWLIHFHDSLGTKEFSYTNPNTKSQGTWKKNDICLVILINGLNSGKISQLWNTRTEDNVDTKSEKTLPVNQPVQEQWWLGASMLCEYHTRWCSGLVWDVHPSCTFLLFPLMSPSFPPQYDHYQHGAHKTSHRHPDKNFQSISKQKVKFKKQIRYR